MRETNNPKLGKCPKCGQNTPLRSGSCLYCGALLDDVRPLAASSEKAHEEPRQLGGQPRHVKTYDGRHHYLFLGAREPLILEPDKLFVIGRDPHSSLIVHSAEVSRQHCEIDWRGDPPRPLLIEVRARNGTYVNDKALRRGEPEALRDRDVIRLGRDFEIVYRHLDERELKEVMNDTGRADTRAVRLPQPQTAAPPVPVPMSASLPYPAPMPMAAAPVAQPASILPDVGELSRIPGALLLDMLHRERRSGVLTIFDGQTAGEIRLADGRAKSAVFGALSSREALEAIAATVRGAYRFVPDAALPMPQAAPQQAGVSPELLAAYQAQLNPQQPPQPMVTPELAALLAVAQGAPPSPLPASPLKPPTGYVAPLRGAPEPTPAQIAAVLATQQQQRGSITTASQSREAVLQQAGVSPPSPQPRPQDALRPPTQQNARPPSASPPAAVRNDPLRPPTQQVVKPPPERGSSSSARQRPPLEPLQKPADPYVKAPAPSAPPPTSGYAAPPSSSNGDSPEAREANALLATVRAVGLAGEALGNFVGDTMAKLLEDGKLEIALELGERGLELADKGSFEAALATRVAFKAKIKEPKRIARALELVEKNTARGPAWAARAASRALKLIDPEIPPEPKDSTVLGRLAALAAK